MIVVFHENLLHMHVSTYPKKWLVMRFMLYRMRVGGGALFMQKQKTIPLKLQLLRIHICKKTYNSWNIPDNESNSRQ